jgi:hypothetical protein
MFSIIFSIILLIIGLLGFKYIGYLGSLLLLIDITIKYFDITKIKVLISVIVILTLIGLLWEKSYIGIIAYDIFLIIVILLFKKIYKSKSKNDNSNLFKDAQNKDNN